MILFTIPLVSLLLLYCPLDSFPVAFLLFTDFICHCVSDLSRLVVSLLLIMSLLKISSPILYLIIFIFTNVADLSLEWLYCGGYVTC